MFRMYFLIGALLLAFSAAAQDSAGVPAVPVGTNYVWTEVVSGFDNPLYVTHAGDGSGRLFVVEQTGYVLVVADGDYLFDPFLDVSGLLSDDVFQGGYTERGLLGLAFAPDYANSGVFYISHTDEFGNNVIARYRVSADDPNRADDSSREIIYQAQQLFYDHNGGHIAFGPDGYLYISIGDGGSLGDNPGVTSQNLTLPLGKMMRIDVRAPQGDFPYTIPPDNPFVGLADALPEIWAYGLRNPWRFSFDRLTGDLYIGDVGQMEYEEIDFEPAGSPGGVNYGWFLMEGLHPYRGTEDMASQFTPPIVEYPHIVGCSVTGGYVYRGAQLPELSGVYFFGDYCNGRTWSLFRDSEGRWKVQPFTETGKVISSFGEDEAGELIMVDYKGGIYRLERAQ
ncbi:MAG: PQQ-dependent sugar dehydrogenase [Anaerolineae bacterium]|nr:PQQ-dependent sugar dehydrogenase [Anaerolineae bacterium]NUQ02807.1 PQQ-dependent sugar dehydrogenase [Anaerolineae bacterium]